MNQQSEIEVYFAPEYKELNKPSQYWRNMIFYGGRYSGKSYHVALALLLKGRREKKRILCAREVQNTIRDSVHKLLKDIIEKYNFTDYTVTNDAIINNIYGTEFIFKGLRQNINEIKSTEGIDICWVEEAQSVSDKSWDVLTPTIRKEGSQIIATFNRFAELDPVYVRYVMNQPPNTYVKKVNYDVLERCGLMTEAIYNEMEADKANPELYNHKWLGEPLSQSEQALLNRTAILEAMQREVDDEGDEFIGVDVARMGNDRTVFVRRKGLQTKNYKVMTKMRTTEICDALEKFARFRKDTLIKVDDTGVGGGVTDEMKKRGYNVLGVNFGGAPNDRDKYPNWISEAWFYLSSIIDRISLPMDSDLLMELSTRNWSIDVRGKRKIEPKEQYKKRGFRSPDLADAFIICFSDTKPKGLNILF